jgi:hypothetical protein
MLFRTIDSCDRFRAAAVMGDGRKPLMRARGSTVFACSRWQAYLDRERQRIIDFYNRQRRRVQPVKLVEPVVRRCRGLEHSAHGFRVAQAARHQAGVGEDASWILKRFAFAVLEGGDLGGPAVNMGEYRLVPVQLQG